MTTPQANGLPKGFDRLVEIQTLPVVANPCLRTLPIIPEAPRFGLVVPEGDDAALNGMTRSLQRRLFGLNVPAFRQAA